MQEEIEKLLQSKDWRVRFAAMKACEGRQDISLDIIERGLSDDEWNVRRVTMEACVGRQDIVSRSFEPPARVWKKCLNDVIVEAEIPADASVRGKAGQKCRASKAHIVAIHGDVEGIKVGISIHDNTVWYREGDDIIIDDFDLSNEECSSGYHFFCTREEAENIRRKK